MKEGAVRQGLEGFPGEYVLYILLNIFNILLKLNILNYLGGQLMLDDIQVNRTYSVTEKYTACEE